MAFLPEEKKQCADFINYLLNSNSEDYFNEFCVSSDGCCTIIYWIRKPFRKEYEMGGFEYVGGDEEIFTEEEIDKIADARAENILANKKVLDNELK